MIFGAGYFAAGQRLTAADLQTICDQLDELTASGWTSYTPELTASGTAPSLGNGTAAGRYRRSADSDLVVAEATITLGSTSTIGTGTLYVSLPVTASAAALAQPTLGAARILDTSVQPWNAVAMLDTTARVRFIGYVGTVTHTWIGTWATGDALSFQLVYEPA
jgi:hypothetical protein